MLFILLVPPLILPLIIIHETQSSSIFYTRCCTRWCTSCCPPPADGPARHQAVLPAGLALAALADSLLIEVGQGVLLDWRQCRFLWQVGWLGLTSDMITLCNDVLRSFYSTLQTCRAWSRCTWRRMPGCLRCLPCRGKTRGSQEARTSSWRSCPAAFSSSGFHNLCGQVWNRYVNKYLCRWPVSCSKIRGQQWRGNRRPSLTWLSLRKRERGREFVHLQRPTKTSKRQKNLTSTTKLSKPIIRYN